MNRCCFLFLLLAMPFLLPGQFCGVQGKDAEQIFQRNQKMVSSMYDRPVSGREIQYIPIVFHLIANSDGLGRETVDNALEALCRLNEDFAELNVQFFLKNGGFNFIDNTTLYNNPGLNGSVFVMRRERDTEALNVFIPQSATPPQGGSSPGVVLGYYDPFNDWVLCARGDVNASSIVLSHEIGHFFTLSHPHLGWDAQPWINTNFENNQAPPFSPGNRPTELMDGSNCENAGDNVCDTPPDYNFGFGWNGPPCNYNGGARDPNGEIVDPDETNLMNYFLSCDRDIRTFTPTQQDMMLQNIAQRSIFPASVENEFPPLEGPVTLQSPIGGVETPGFNLVELNWQALPGATSYYLEVDRVPTFSIEPRQLFSTTNSLTLEDLEPNRVYYWRVYAYNPFDACAGYSTTASFRTGEDMISSSVEVELLEEWTILPNPVRQGAALNMQMSIRQSFRASIELLSLDGRRVLPLKERDFPAGQENWTISTQGLSPGVYLLSLATEAGRISRRVVIR